MSANTAVLVGVKVIHRAKHIREDGAVSPLCAKIPRAIDLSRATWSNRDEAVTCPKCLELMKEPGR